MEKYLILWINIDSKQCIYTSFLFSSSLIKQPMNCDGKFVAECTDWSPEKEMTWFSLSLFLSFLSGINDHEYSFFMTPKKNKWSRSPFSFSSRRTDLILIGKWALVLMRLPYVDRSDLIRLPHISLLLFVNREQTNYRQSQVDFHPWTEMNKNIRDHFSLGLFISVKRVAASDNSAEN